MKRYLTVAAALATSLMSSAFVPSLKAGEWDKKTLITISAPVSVEGTILPAGRYVLRLPDTAANRDTVYIFNADETRLVTTILAIPAYRQYPADKSEFSFYNSPAGPAALHTWFYPGDNRGFEFLPSQLTLAAKSKSNPKSNPAGN
jgi:hypothetical protein